MTTRTADDLAREAASCIEVNNLTGEELRLYLTVWICECAEAGDLDSLRAERKLASKRYDRKLDE